jgi:branched-chain amino acid transport system substrate-binding protein
MHTENEINWSRSVLNSKAITKIQTAILITIITLAAVGGAATYFANNENSPSQPTSTPLTTTTPEPSTVTPTSSTTPTATSTPSATALVITPTPQPKEPIRIGVCADIGTSSGTWTIQGATLAVEQINAVGGLLGRNLTVVAEDDDGKSGGTIETATNALIKLITIDKADYVITVGKTDTTLLYQDRCSELKKIHFSVTDPLENLTQRVLDDYNKYKYSFRGEAFANATTMNIAHVQSLAALKNVTDFTKVGYLMFDTPATREASAYFENELPKLGFQITYRGFFPYATTIDFTSYFAQAEAAKTQILFVTQADSAKCAAVINEWHNRQSPMLLCGDITGATNWDFWNVTYGNTEFVFTKNTGLTMNYPITNKTAPVKDAYLARWGALMSTTAAVSYDVVKFFLADAITRAATTETDAVIKALETINIDTVLTNDFRFTSNHDIYVEATGMMNLSKTTLLYIVVQWQNGVQVPIFPESLRVATGTTFKYPPWQGPWSQ